MNKIKSMSAFKLFSQISKYSIQAQLDDFEEYVNRMSVSHGADLSELKQAYEEEKRDATDDYIEYLDDYYSEQYEFLSKIQPNIFNKSALVSFYSCLEYNLNNLCDLCQRIKGIEISVSDLNGEGIHKAKKYLNKIMGVEFGTSQEWEFITELNRVRNCIVHANGEVNKSKSAEKLKDIINMDKNLSLNNGSIMISSEYLTKTISEINKFFLWLYEHIEKSSN